MLCGVNTPDMMTTIAVVTAKWFHMLIEDWRIDRVRPYPNNPRVLRNAAEKVAESIKAFGWRQPIVVDDEGVVIAGHSRLAAAKLLKLETVPVHVASDLSADQVRALRVADNKTATFSDWDDAKLADELSEIMGSLSGATYTGFSQSEFDAIAMRAQAEVAEITSKLEQPAPAEPDPDDDENDQPDEPPADDVAGTDTDPEPDDSSESDSQPELVAFNVLMTVEARQTVYDAIAKAKNTYGLTTTADALAAICRNYTHA